MDGYGLVYADDQMFGNMYSTDIRYPDGTEEQHIGQRPEHYFGVSALVCFKENEFHLMGEDDGHFWTNAILTQEECKELSEVISKIGSSVTLKPKWKYRLDRSFRDKWEHPKFPAKVEIRKDATPLVTSWCESFLATLVIRDKRCS
jgi:hypothetical protein